MQAQKWGQGSKRARNPKFIIDFVPEAKKFHQWDPRPPALRYTSQTEINDFLTSCQTLPFECNWSSVPPFYEDYELTLQRKLDIVQKSAAFILNMKSALEKYAQDPLTTNAGYHITGTIGQGNSDIWHDMRENKVTASNFYDWITSAKAAINRYYNDQEDISNIPWIKWGRDNEDVCISQYNETHSDKITKCGCFVSKKEVNILASPDGLILNQNKVVEIKCPWNRKEVNPNVRIPDFCYFDEDGNIQLKRNHKYFWQIQSQMYTTGFKKGKFLV